MEQLRRFLFSGVMAAVFCCGAAELRLPESIAGVVSVEPG